MDNTQSTGYNKLMKKLIKNKHQKVRTPVDKPLEKKTLDQFVTGGAKASCYWPRVTLVSAPQVLKHIAFLGEWHIGWIVAALQ